MENAGRVMEYQKTVVIEDQEYKLILFVPSRAFKLGARVAKFVGEPAAAMASAAGDETKVIEILPTAIRSLLSNLHEDEVWQLVIELMTCVSQGGQMLNVDIHFKGRLGILFQLVGKVVEYQFSDFFDAIGKAIAGVADKTRAA